MELPPSRVDFTLLVRKQTSNISDEGLCIRAKGILPERLLINVRAKKESCAKKGNLPGKTSNKGGKFIRCKTSGLSRCLLMLFKCADRGFNCYFYNCYGKWYICVCVFVLLHFHVLSNYKYNQKFNQSFSEIAPAMKTQFTVYFFISTY